MSKSNVQEKFISAALLVILAVVFRDIPQLCAMFRSLNPRLFKRRISRYWIIVVTSFICIHTKVCIYSIKKTICNRAQSGSELPEFAAPILRDSGSQSPDRWLKEPRNNHIRLWSVLPVTFPLSNRPDTRLSRRFRCSPSGRPLGRCISVFLIIV